MSGNYIYKTLLYTLITTFGILIHASTVRGGGDPLAIQFQQAAMLAAESLSEVKVLPFSNVDINQLKNKIKTAQIIVVDELVPLRVGEFTQNTAFSNDPAKSQIFINRSQYAQIQNTSIEQPLALHEYLSLIGIESTGKYPISGLYQSQTDEKVKSFSFQEEIGCAVTSRERILCFSTKPPFVFAHSELLYPPSNLIKPKEIVVSLGSACVTTQLGVKCWGQDAEILQNEAKDWKDPQSLNLFLVEYGNKYLYVLCAMTASGPACTYHKDDKAMPQHLSRAEKFLSTYAFGSCVLIEGKISCWDAPANSNPTFASIPKNLGRILDFGYGGGGLFGCAITTLKGLACWGQLSSEMIKLVRDGSIENSKQYKKLGVSSDEVCAIDQDGYFRCFGESYRDVDYIPSGTGSVSQIETSGTNKCVVNSVGKLRCWSDIVGPKDELKPFAVPVDIRY